MSVRHISITLIFMILSFYCGRMYQDHIQAETSRPIIERMKRQVVIADSLTLVADSLITNLKKGN